MNYSVILFCKNIHIYALHQLFDIFFQVFIQDGCYLLLLLVFWSLPTGLLLWILIMWQSKYVLKDKILRCARYVKNAMFGHFQISVCLKRLPISSIIRVPYSTPFLCLSGVRIINQYNKQWIKHFNGLQCTFKLMTICNMIPKYFFFEDILDYVG